jgi:cob(I)alamin adenosyltransferase
MELELEPLRAFILPGGSRAAAMTHIVRTVCRRAERRVNALDTDRGGTPAGVLSFLNRLSDAFFVLARFINVRAGSAETEWRSRARG